MNERRMRACEYGPLTPVDQDQWREAIDNVKGKLGGIIRSRGQVQLRTP